MAWGKIPAEILRALSGGKGFVRPAKHTEYNQLKDDQWRLDLTFLTNDQHVE